MVDVSKLLGFAVISLSIWVGSATVEAASISVQGLFKNKAVLLIDGTRYVLNVGERLANGVSLESIKNERIVLLVAGKRRTLKLGEFVGVSTKFVQPDQTVVTISKNTNGMYTTVGSINGLTVKFLVDTGASLIAINAAEAVRLGIDYERVGVSIFVTTASKIEKAFRVKLRTVSVGEITLTNVSAIVMTGQQPSRALLGMSFLGTVDINRSGNIMTLKKRF